MRTARWSLVVLAVGAFACSDGADGARRLDTPPAEASDGAFVDPERDAGVGDVGPLDAVQPADAHPASPDVESGRFDVGPGSTDAASRPDARATTDADPPGDARVAPRPDQGSPPPDRDADPPPPDGARPDAAPPEPDGAPPDPDAGPAEPDAAPPVIVPEHIHVEVDNFCNMRVDPPEVHVPAGQTAFFTYHNHSVDYPIDVWMSYGGGYLELATRDSWRDPIEQCTGPRRPRQAWADISTACSEHRFLIHCDD